MIKLIYIFLGGGLGSLARFGISRIFSTSTQLFPFPTVAANFLASLILGIVLGYLTNQSKDSYLYFLLVVGFCGGFSTFSTFTAENWNLLSKHQYAASFLYMFGSIAVCLAALVVGYFLSTKLFLAKN